MAGGKGTTPIHNKKPKKKESEEDEVDIANKKKLREDEAARKEMVAKQKGKGGPLNTGQQGIKKSGKK